MNKLNKTDITLAIPFYGNINYLEKTLASIRSQTVSNWVAIVVDDCSPTSGVRDLVEGFGDYRITYIRNDKNLGLAGNWNRCIELCITDLISLVHGDDELMPQYVETMLAAHIRWQDASAIFCGAKIIDERGMEVFSFRDYVKSWLLPSSKYPYILSGKQGFAALLCGNIIMCPTLCYKTPLFEEMSFDAKWRMVLDLDFYFRAMLSDKIFVGVQDVAYKYRRHSKQVTADCERDLRIFTEEVELWSLAADEAKIRKWSDVAQTAKKMAIIKLQLLYYLLTDLVLMQGRSAGKKLSLLLKILREN